jgi:hypothetical protein
MPYIAQWDQAGQCVVIDEGAMHFAKESPILRRTSQWLPYVMNLGL